MVAIQVAIMGKFVDDSEPVLKKVAIAMKEKFEKYWGDWDKINHLLFIANILDPRNKLQMIKVSVKKMGGDAQKVQEQIGPVKSELITLWAEYKGQNDTMVSERQNTPLEISDGDGTSSRGGRKFCSFLYAGVEEQNEEEQLQQISNEVDKYLADEIEKRSNPNFDLLTWWKGCESKYPVLSLIAKDIFAIPSSTVASESVFSLGKRVVDPFRTSLSPKMVEASVCTNDWLKAEDFSLYKDPTDDDFELYKEIEEIEKNASINQDSSQTITPTSTLSS